MKNFEHQPVMRAEVLAALRPEAGRRYVDGTLGGGGHAAAILAASFPNGFLVGCDRDGIAVAAATERLQEFKGRFTIYQSNFDELGNRIEAESCDGVLFDLGVSSPQLDVAERGFSFQNDGPLDMRMDRRQTVTAAQLVNELSAEELAKIFWEYADERDSRRIARAVERDRKACPFVTTRQLAELMERIAPRQGRKAHPATKIFQALRIAVNDEIGSLRRGLDGSLKILKAGGRLAVITFHSLEDRVVKTWGRKWAQDYEVIGEVDVPMLRKPVGAKLKLINRKALLPSEEEQRNNPRSRSAQLRVFEKI